MSRRLTRLQAILLGTVVLTCIGLMIIGLFALADRQRLWGDTFHVRVGFRQIRGVEVGTRVRVQGIDAGEVEIVTPPASPGEDVLLRLRLDRRLKTLIREDAAVQVVSEGMIGGKVLEIDPGTSSAGPVADDSILASRPSAELTDVLAQVSNALGEVRDGQGALGKLLKEPEAYSKMLALLQQSHDTMVSFQHDADALKRMPVVRRYVQDAQTVLMRANCERKRLCFAEGDLFEPGQAALTANGRARLDGVAPWLAGLKHKGSEVVIATYADPRVANPSTARTRTRLQSEAVCSYLKSHHAVQKMGWFSRRKVTPLGLGTDSPPVPEKEELPADRVEVLVFVPQG